MSEKNNGINEVNQQIRLVRNTTVGNIVTTASNRAQQATQQLLAPINEAALKAAKTVIAIQDAMQAVADTVNTIIDTGFLIFRILSLGPGILVEEAKKFAKKSLKEKIADVVNGIVNEVKLAVSTLIGAFINIVEDTIDTITSTAKRFQTTIIGAINTVEESTTEAFGSIKDNIEEEMEVGLISGEATAQVKDTFSDISNTALRNFQRNPSLEQDYKRNLSNAFIKGIANNISTFRSPKMSQREEINRLKFIDLSPPNRPNLDFSDEDQDVQAREVFDGNVVNKVEENVKKVNEGELYKSKNRNGIFNTAKELLTIQQIKEESNKVQSIPPMNEGEFLSFVDGAGLPTRLTNAQNLVNLDYNLCFGSRDIDSVRLCLIKNNVEIFDDRFPEISGDRGDNLNRLRTNRVINDNTDITLYSGDSDNAYLDKAFSDLKQEGDKWNIEYPTLISGNLYETNQTESLSLTIDNSI